MYTKIDNYYEWLGVILPKDNKGKDIGRKFFHCFIENNFEFQYWAFVPKDLNN